MLNIQTFQGYSHKTLIFGDLKYELKEKYQFLAVCWSRVEARTSSVGTVVHHGGVCYSPVDTITI